jgi:hypothetical protein
MNIDGNLSDWAVPSSVTFSGPSTSVTVYVVWNITNLYLAFRATDTQLNASETARDGANLYLDDTVEAYIDTLFDRASVMQSDDYQFLVNLNNAQGDLRGTGSGKDATWNAVFASAVTRQGTLNSNADSDVSYIVEMAIPWAQIGMVPTGGKRFGLDLAVDDRDPVSTPNYATFDWAGIAPNPYAQPSLWKRIELIDGAAPFPVAPTGLVVTRQ